MVVVLMILFSIGAAADGGTEPEIFQAIQSNDLT